MASRTLPGSTSSRLASTGLSRFFFQPVELELKLTDLLIQSCLKALLVLRPFGATVGEDLRQPFYGLLLPTRDLIRMYTKAACQLGHRAFAADRRQRHLGLKCLGKCPSLLCHEFTSWSFIRSSSANPPYSRAQKSPTIILRVDLFVLHASPQTFDHDVVERPPFTVHADLHLGLFEPRRKRLARELASLVRVEDPRPCRQQGSLQRGQAELRVQRDRQIPTQHVPAVPVHHRHQVDETTMQPNVGDVA